MHCGKDSDDAAGVQVSGFEDSFPDAENSGIQRGMKILSVNGEDVSTHSQNATIAIVRAAGRPLTMEFTKKKKLVNGVKAAAQRTIAALAREHELETFQKLHRHVLRSFVSACGALRKGEQCTCFETWCCKVERLFPHLLGCTWARGWVDPSRWTQLTPTLAPYVSERFPCVPPLSI